MLALKDQLYVERSKKYKVDMAVYHSRTRNHERVEQCHVCFAGGIMCRLAKPDDDLTASSFIGKEEAMFRALDQARDYNFGSMLNYVGRHYHPARSALFKHFNTDYLPSYRENPLHFRQNMETIAAILAEHGL